MAIKSAPANGWPFLKKMLIQLKLAISLDHKGGFPILNDIDASLEVFNDFDKLISYKKVEPHYGEILNKCLKQLDDGYLKLQQSHEFPVHYGKSLRWELPNLLKFYLSVGDPDDKELEIRTRKVIKFIKLLNSNVSTFNDQRTIIELFVVTWHHLLAKKHNSQSTVLQTFEKFSQLSSFRNYIINQQLNIKGNSQSIYHVGLFGNSKTVDEIKDQLTINRRLEYTYWDIISYFVMALILLTAIFASLIIIIQWRVFFPGDKPSLIHPKLKIFIGPLSISIGAILLHSTLIELLPTRQIGIVNGIHYFLLDKYLLFLSAIFLPIILLSRNLKNESFQDSCPPPVNKALKFTFGFFLLFPLAFYAIEINIFDKIDTIYKIYALAAAPAILIIFLFIRYMRYLFWKEYRNWCLNFSFNSAVFLVCSLLAVTAFSIPYLSHKEAVLYKQEKLMKFRTDRHFYCPYNTASYLEFVGKELQLFEPDKNLGVTDFSEVTGREIKFYAVNLHGREKKLKDEYERVKSQFRSNEHERQP